MFWVFLFIAITIASQQQCTGSNLHLYGNEYAGNYDNYEPHDYQFEYGVSDPHTGDHKSQWEVKEKGVVRGGYSLLEPDGTTRIVEYIADDDGFRAVVKKLGTSIHPQIETHGNVEVAPVPSVPAHHAYDGHAENYAHVLNAAVKHLEPQSYIQPIEIPHIEEYHGYNPNIPAVSHESQGYVNNLQPITSGYDAPKILAPQLDFSQQPLLPHTYTLPDYQPKLVIKESLPYKFSIPQQQQHILPHPQASGILANQHYHSPELSANQYYQAPEFLANQHYQPPGLVINQHYQPQVSEHGLTGNPGDDVTYTNYNNLNNNNYGYYQGEYSQKISRVVAPPKAKQAFVINVS